MTQKEAHSTIKAAAEALQKRGREILRPLAHAEVGVTVGEKGTHRDGQDGAEGVTDASFQAKVHYGLQALQEPS